MYINKYIQDAEPLRGESFLLTHMQVLSATCKWVVHKSIESVDYTNLSDTMRGERDFIGYADSNCMVELATNQLS